jgi:hypothetical protein
MSSLNPENLVIQKLPSPLRWVGKETLLMAMVKWPKINFCTLSPTTSYKNLFCCAVADTINSSNTCSLSQYRCFAHRAKNGGAGKRLLNMTTLPKDACSLDEACFTHNDNLTFNLDQTLSFPEGQTKSSLITSSGMMTFSFLSKHNFLTLIKTYLDLDFCSYSPEYGDNINRICSAVADSKNQNNVCSPLEYRCFKHRNLKSQEDLFTEEIKRPQVCPLEAGACLFHLEKARQASKDKALAYLGATHRPKSDSDAKPELTNCEWIDVDHYLFVATNNPEVSLCGFSPLKGKKEGLFCGSEVVDVVASPFWEKRCNLHHGKRSKGMDFLLAALFHHIQDTEEEDEGDEESETKESDDSESEEEEEEGDSEDEERKSISPPELENDSDTENDKNNSDTENEKPAPNSDGVVFSLTDQKPEEDLPLNPCKVSPVTIIEPQTNSSTS